MRWFMGGRGGHARGTGRRAEALRRRMPEPLSTVRHWSPRILAFTVLAASFALLLAAGMSGPAGARADALKDSGTLHIVVPSGGSGSPSGPVGTFVTVQATGLAPTAGYKLGVALKDAGCQGGFSDLGQPTSADATGSFVATFQWPSSANDTGSSYDVCAQSQADNSFVQSDSTFTVLGATAPSISAKRVAAPVGSGTPAPETTTQPLPTGVYQAGDYVQIKGKNFLPGGTSLSVYLTANQIKAAQDLQGLTPLQTADSSSIASDDSGSFTTIVQIPAQTQSQQYYLYVVSGDSDPTTKAPPSLEAFKQVFVEPAPSPTATPTNTPTTAPVTPTPKSNGTSTGDNGGGGKPTGAIIGLGIASVILFILGVILLASAATTPGARPEQR